MTAKKISRLVLGILLAALFLWLIFRQISPEEIKHAFEGASLVLAALAAFGFGYSCRIERWSFVLERDNPTLKWLSCADPLLSSFLRPTTFCRLEEAMYCALLPLALPSIVAPLAGWLALPVGTLATLIPTTPGYIGTFDFFTLRAMTALSNNSAAATAYALLVQALLWLPPTLVGGLYLLLHLVKQQDKLKVI